MTKKIERGKKKKEEIKLKVVNGKLGFLFLSFLHSFVFFVREK